MEPNDIARCPGCGHNYFTDAPERNGYCHWCVSEGIWSVETKAAVEQRAAADWQRRIDSEKQRYERFLASNDGDPWGYQPADGGAFGRL